MASRSDFHAKTNGTDVAATFASVVEGKVIAHSPERLNIEEVLGRLRNEKLAIEYTGGGTGEAYLL